MLDTLYDFNSTLLDPHCGTDNLLAAAVLSGFTILNVHGIEIDENILLAKKHLSKLDVPSENLSLGNALSFNSYLV